MELVGIIQVPVSAFFNSPNVGRGRQPALVKKLSRVFQRTKCRPKKESNHAEGLVDRETLRIILSKLQLSLGDLRSTLKCGTYPKVLLQRCILCIDGKQRIAAAEKMFGPKYWWTVQVYYAREGFPRIQANSRSRHFLHQARLSDGEIYRNLRGEQLANRLQAAQELRVQLSPCKEKILNQILSRQPPEGFTESVVDALDSLIPYPGLWDGLEIANWHRYLALHCDEQIVCYLSNHLRSTYEQIVSGVTDAKQYVDSMTVRCLALRCPHSKADAMFIREKMDSREMFCGITNEASRRQILENILSINTVIPSLKTFHENMKYFAIGAKILRKHIVPEVDGAKGETWTLTQKLQWNPSPNPTIEAAAGNFLPLQNLNSSIALKALFLVALTAFPYLSNDRPKQDARGEIMAAAVDPGSVYLLQNRARRLGFSSPTIEKGLSGRPPVSRAPFYLSDQQISSNWKCGKPGIRAFLHLQDHAFLPNLAKVDGKNGLVPMFVFKDFMDAFFGNETIMMDVGDSEIAPDTPLQQFVTDEQQPASGPPIPEVDMVDENASAATQRSPKATSRRSGTRRWNPLSRLRVAQKDDSSRNSSRSPQTRQIDPRRTLIQLSRMATQPSTVEGNIRTPEEAVTTEPMEHSTGIAGRDVARRSYIAPPDTQPSPPRLPVISTSSVPPMFSEPLNHQTKILPEENRRQGVIFDANTTQLFAEFMSNSAEATRAQSNFTTDTTPQGPFDPISQKAAEFRLDFRSERQFQKAESQKGRKSMRRRLASHKDKEVSKKPSKTPTVESRRKRQFLFKYRQMVSPQPSDLPIPSTPKTSRRSLISAPSISLSSSQGQESQAQEPQAQEPQTQTRKRRERDSKKLTPSIRQPLESERPLKRVKINSGQDLSHKHPEDLQERARSPVEAPSQAYDDVPALGQHEESFPQERHPVQQPNTNTDVLPQEMHGQSSAGEFFEVETFTQTRLDSPERCGVGQWFETGDSARSLPNSPEWDV